MILFTRTGAPRMDEESLTLRELSARWGCSVDRLRRMIRKGLLSTEPGTRPLRIPPAEVVRLEAAKVLLEE